MKQAYFLAAFFLAAAVHALPREIDRIVAVVNNEVIMLSEFKLEIKKANKTKVKLPPGRSFSDRVLELLIIKRIRQQILDKAGVDVSESIIDKAVEQIAENNKLSVKELARVLPQQNMTMSKLRTRIKKEIQNSFFQQHYLQTAKKNLSEREIKAKVKKLPKSVVAGERPIIYHVFHILLETGEFAPEDKVRARAELIAARLRRGEDFQQIAQEISDAPTAQHGGNLGWRMAQDFPEIISARLAGAKKGQIIGPLKDENGFHIFSPLEIEGGKVFHKFSAKELREQAKEQLLFEKTEKFTEKLLKKLRRQAQVEKRL